MPEGPPKLSSNVLGYLPGISEKFKGRPIVAHEGGQGHSTHYNMVTQIDGREYIVPQMFGGKLVDPDTAIRTVRQSGMIDPDTGEPIQGFDTVEEALQKERELHDVLDRRTQEIILQKQVEDLLK